MANMSPRKNEMPCQDPEVRAGNFDEVALGYTEEQATDEAKRCLKCKNRPCMQGCPVGVRIPEFIEKVAAGEFEEAYGIITDTNALPAVCGRVCPQENQCEGKCVRGIKGEPVGIGRLERYVADYHNTHKENAEEPEIKKNGKRVAVVGSGPAGLTCAGVLAKKGYEVTVYEALHTAGGVLAYGIPEFRLPKKILKTEVDGLKKMGVKILTNVVIGKTLTLEEICDEYDSVFLGTGAGLPQFMNIKGENLCGVYSSNEFLTRINLMKAYEENARTPLYRPKKAVVVGGGNVAMDSARCARRLGAEVTIVYRRTENELPARKEEVENAKEEGVVFHMLASPVEAIGDENGWVKAVKCEIMKLGEADASGRAKPVPSGEYFTIEADCFIVAIGTTPNPLIKKTSEGLEFDKKGCIVTDESNRTTKEGVYAGGDVVTGAATVISAMGAGKTAAESIDEYLSEK